MKDGGSVIDDHRKMLLLSGNLSSFQIDNLKAFPKIVFDDIKNFTLHYDFYKSEEKEGKEEKEGNIVCSGKVIYDIVFEKEPKYKDLEKRIIDIKFWVKSLFWKDTVVTIKKDGKIWM